MDTGKKKTKVVKKNLNPEWNQEFRYSTWATSEKLLLQVWNYTGGFSRKMFIGQVVFSHPDQGVIHGVFPLVDQKDEPVGGTVEVAITCEYLVGIERRLSQEAIELKREPTESSLDSENAPKIRKQLEQTPLEEWNENDKKRYQTALALIKKEHNDDPIPDTPYTPTAVQPQVFQEPQDNKDEKDKELERIQKELEEAKEKENQREREREEHQTQLEEALKRVAELEEVKKKNNTALELLQKELAEVRQTVSGLEESKFNCCAWFARLFPCCFMSNKTRRIQTETNKTAYVEMNEMGRSAQQLPQASLDDTVTGSLDNSAHRSITPDDSTTSVAGTPADTPASTPAGTPEQSYRRLSHQTSLDRTMNRLEIPSTNTPIETLGNA